MKHFAAEAGFLLVTVASALAQTNSNPLITIPATNGSLPAAASSNGCAAGYSPGTSTILYTVPYTYQQVLSIIGNYTNLTWSGSPPNSVTTNNTAALTTNNWTPGTARFYSLAGAYVIETITEYSKPANGPYVEVHTLAPLTVPSANISVYSDFDGQVWKPTCNGGATWANFTINFCATNVTVAKGLLDQLHLSDAQTVGKFLGGQNFTSCGAIHGGTGSASPSMFGGWMGNATATATGTTTAASCTASISGYPCNSAVGASMNAASKSGLGFGLVVMVLGMMILLA